MPIFQWIYLLWWILPSGNAMGVMPIFQWMYLLPWMLLPRNSVRVVLLIARGWRGTSLPRVNVRKEIQRHRCWAFSMKACLQWNLLWQINQKKRNTYGVVPRTIYANPGLPALSFGNPGLSKVQHLRRWNVLFIFLFTFSHVWIHGELRLESATPMALFPTNHTLTQGSLHYRLATLGYQKRNTYGVEMFIL